MENSSSLNTTSSCKVSVIVPVYNVEKYLPKCLDSLVNQTLKEIEIIVVNDGTKDNSQNIIDDYARRYPQLIKPYSKPNGGLSDARNFGMMFASGEYIGFIDSDDFVDLDMYEVMYKKAKESNFDIVECNLHHTYDDGEDTEIGKTITDKKWLLMDGRSVVWNKIYKSSWLKDTKVTFHKGVIYEDVEFFCKLVPHITSYAYVEPAFVHYVQRGNSINNESSEKTIQIFTVLNELLTYYKENGFYDEYEKALEYLFARILLCSSFSRMCKIKDKKVRQDVLDKNYKLLTDNFPNWKDNAFIKLNNTRNGMFMKSINDFTYKAYCKMLPAVFMARAKSKGL